MGLRVEGNLPGVLRVANIAMGRANEKGAGGRAVGLFRKRMQDTVGTPFSRCPTATERGNTAKAQTHKTFCTRAH